MLLPHLYFWVKIMNFKSGKPIYLDIPPLARRLMIALSVFHVIGLGVYIYLFFFERDFDLSLVMSAIVGALGAPFSFCLMSIPAVSGRFPGWVVAIFGEKYLNNLALDARAAWVMLTGRWN